MIKIKISLKVSTGKSLNSYTRFMDSTSLQFIMCWQLGTKQISILCFSTEEGHTLYTLCTKNTSFENNNVTVLSLAVSPLARHWRTSVIPREPQTLSGPASNFSSQPVLEKDSGVPVVCELCLQMFA